MPLVLTLLACVFAAGVASSQARGDDPAPPPATTSASEPITVPSPQPAPGPEPKPDPAPPGGALQPSKPEKASSPPAPVAVQPPVASPPPAKPASTAAPKPKHEATQKKKLHTKAGAGKKHSRPKQQTARLGPSGGDVTHATAGDAPPVSELGEPLRHGGGEGRAVLSAMLFAMLGLAIALFGLAALPTGVLGDALVSVLVATRRVELAAGGALTLAASVTILAFISLSS